MKRKSEEDMYFITKNGKYFCGFDSDSKPIFEDGIENVIVNTFDACHAQIFLLRMFHGKEKYSHERR